MVADLLLHFCANSNPHSKGDGKGFGPKSQPASLEKISQLPPPPEWGPVTEWLWVKVVQPQAGNGRHIENHDGSGRAVLGTEEGSKGGSALGGG